MSEGLGEDELAAARLTEGRAILARLVGERDELRTAAVAEMRARRARQADAPARRALEDWDEALAARFARLFARAGGAGEPG